jgi:hypothetical protein
VGNSEIRPLLEYVRLRTVPLLAREVSTHGRPPHGQGVCGGLVAVAPAAWASGAGGAPGWAENEALAKDGARRTAGRLGYRAGCECWLNISCGRSPNPLLRSSCPNPYPPSRPLIHSRLRRSIPQSQSPP